MDQHKNVKGFVDEDVSLSIASTAPAPLTVAAPALAVPVGQQPTLTPAVATKPVE